MVGNCPCSAFGEVKLNESSCEKINNLGFRPNKMSVQLYKMARGVKFRIYREGEMYCLCSENKGADHGPCLCFRICRLLVSFMTQLK